MISSLKSRFNVYPRRAVCVAADAVSVYHWRQGSVTDTLVFDADDIGLLNFDRYLRETPKTPVYLLVDIVEEEYRQETVPHVFGTDRRAVIERKQSWVFRGTPYWYAMMQGRETEGRRDDRVLLTAIVNPQVVAPWVRLCSQNKIPLAGIYSLPILSGLLLPKIGAESGNTLLVTIQHSSGLRQSYFRDGALAISRLAKMPRIGTVPFAPHVVGELDKLQRYLNSFRLQGPGSLKIYIVTHGDLLDDLADQCQSTEAQQYHLLDVADAARRLGVQGVSTTPFSDHLFAHLLLEATPKNHYAYGDERNYFKLHRARVGMWAASLVLLVGGSIWSCANLVSGLAFKDQAVRAEQKANFYQARFKSAKEELPPTEVEPVDIKTAVDLVDTLAKYKAGPFAMLGVISHALAGFPNLHLNEVRWTTSADPRSHAGLADQTEDAMRAGPPIRAARRLFYQVALVKGYLEPFDGNYREALSAIRSFADSLRSQGAVDEVRIVALPLDFSSKASLQGRAGEAPPEEATFAVKVVLGVGSETG